jgi:hypothetical protein
MWNRPPPGRVKPHPKPPPLPPAVLPEQLEEFQNLPFGVAGEMAVPRAQEPPPPPPPAVVIPAPPWSENYDPELDPDHEPAQSHEPTPNLDEARAMLEELKEEAQP